MRILPALMVVAAASACMGGSGTVTRRAAPGAERHAVPRVPGTDCLAAWNAPANGAVRRATLPPLGPYPIAGDGPQITPRGGYEVFVGPIIFLGIGNLPPRCAVTFRFPHGYREGPATVYYTERGTSGVFGDSEVSVGKNAEESGRVFVQHPDGTLYPTPFIRS